MLQHLLNTTVIWLLCLLAFDLVLRAEKFHGYNRMFLLVSFFMGLLLPFWKWGDDSFVFSGTLKGTATTIADTRQSIESAAVASGAWEWEQYLMVIYLSGVVLMTLLLLVDIVKVALLFNRGAKSKENAWLVVETGKQHSPFSLFNILFVRTKQQFSPGQWDMLLRHEMQHKARGHFFDLLLMQLARIAFCFHPLVYIFQKRLAMVHEYQADAAIEAPVSEYGHFLLEQSLLSDAPAITHSFNRSPIKKRILMLTRTSGKFPRTRQLVLLPLILAGALLFTQRGFSQERKREGNIITYNGNKIEIEEKMLIDTVTVQDPATKEISQKMISMMGEVPAKLNDEMIYDIGNIEKRPVMKGASMKEYIRKKMKSSLEQLPDGTYFIGASHMVLDKKGKIVFYDITPYSINNNMGTLPDEEQKKIAKELSKALDDVSMTPAIMNGSPANYFLGGDKAFSDWDIFIIKGHKLTN